MTPNPETASRIKLGLGLAVAVAVAAALSLVALVVWGARATLQTAEGMGDRIVDIAEGFQTGSITQTFIASLPRLTTDGSGRLELATSTVVETFTRTDERRILWERFSLGETVVEIRAPVTYRYHVRLEDPWRLELSDQTCVVYAPPIRPSLPPAIHTDGMEKRVSSNGWFSLDTDDSMAQLERDLTPIVSNWADDPQHLEAVRDGARRTVAAFVRGWLLREDQWRKNGVRAILVQFADDPPHTPTSPQLTIE